MILLYTMQKRNMIIRYTVKLITAKNMQEKQGNCTENVMHPGNETTWPNLNGLVVLGR